MKILLYTHVHVDPNPYAGQLVLEERDIFGEKKCIQFFVIDV